MLEKVRERDERGINRKKERKSIRLPDKERERRKIKGFRDRDRKTQRERENVR